MATSNPTIAADWTKVVEAGDEFTLGTQESGIVGHYALAVTDTDSAPSTAGQTLGATTGQMSRALTGPGYVWLKQLSGASLQFWLHAWTP